MLFDVADPLRRRAKTPHELSMFNLMFFHLLLGAGSIVLFLTQAHLLHDIGPVGFFLPLVASLLVIGYIHLRAYRAARHEAWFVAAHWRLAMSRSRGHGVFRFGIGIHLSGRPR